MTNYKIKVFHEGIDSLEEAVNDWLSKVGNITIVAVTTYIKHYVTHTITYY